MDSDSDRGTILLVEGDAVLGQVLSRVLARDGLSIVHAASAAQALELADRHAPQLAVLDCGTGEGISPELAEELQRRNGRQPVIVVAAESAAGLEASSGTGSRARFLTKPLDLQNLRQAVDSALDFQESGLRNGPQSSVIRSAIHNLQSAIKELHMRVILVKVLKVTGFVLLLLVVLTGFAVAMGVRPPWQRNGEQADAPAPAKADTLGVALAKEPPHSLIVPEDVRKALGIRIGTKELIYEAKKPTRTLPLVMPGSTLLDPTLLYRLKARFTPSPSTAVVKEIALVPEDPVHSGQTTTVYRELRSGDRVKKDQLLAVFNSVDVGNKKNDLIDAIYQLKLDDTVLKAFLAKPEVVTQAQIWNQERLVRGDENTVKRAVSNLREWGIPEAEIQAARDEAENVIKRGGKHDADKEAQWGRVEMRAPDDGVIVERNVNKGEIIADNTINLFQIAKIDRLSVTANCPEDDVPALEAIPTAQRHWTVKTVGSPPIEGFYEDISYLIDASQHTAVVKGHINNPKGIIRGTQFITATVGLPAPPDVVEVPMDAVVEDGQTCIVFVQTDPEKHPDQFTMRRVKLEKRLSVWNDLEKRYDNIAFVRSKPFPKKEQRTPEEEELGILPKEPLIPGDLVVLSGVGELKAALLDKEESQPSKNGKDGKDK